VAIQLVGKRFRPDQFGAYLDTVKLGSAFQPRSVTLHHTASPTLAQRPNGFTQQHLLNLQHYYGVKMGWHGAPHVFIDDREDGIIVFQPMNLRGVHAVSFNRTSWGMEMLGYYDAEPFHTGRGAAVRDNAMAALAAMCKRLGAQPDSIRFHRDDPTTRKSCPGRLVEKAYVVGRVAELLRAPAVPDMSDEAGWPEWTVLLPGGAPIEPVHVADGRPIVRVRSFVEALAPGGKYALSADKQRVTWTAAGGATKVIPVTELDEAGAAWSVVRDLAAEMGRTVQVAGRTVQVV
jgi:hypothetical protein